MLGALGSGCPPRSIRHTWNWLPQLEDRMQEHGGTGGNECNGCKCENVWQWHMPARNSQGVPCWHVSLPRVDHGCYGCKCHNVWQWHMPARNCLGIPCWHVSLPRVDHGCYGCKCHKRLAVTHTIQESDTRDIENGCGRSSHRCFPEVCEPNVITWNYHVFSAAHQLILCLMMCRNRKTTPETTTSFFFPFIQYMRPTTYIAARCHEIYPYDVML